MSEMSEIDSENEEEMARLMLKMDIKEEKIYRGMDYNELQREIMEGSLSVNTHIKLDQMYHLCYFKRVGITQIYDLTILHLAICLEDEKFVDFLLENNADVLIATEHVGPVIYLAIRMHNLDYVQKLVDAGASVNKSFCLRGLELDEVFVRDDSGNTSYRVYRYDDYSPLQFAIKMGSYYITKFLLSRCADVNYRGSKDIPPPFNLCVKLDWNDLEDQLNNIEIMKLLVEYGADVNMVDADGYQKTPLLQAASNPKSTFVLDFLLDLPTIDVNAVDNHKRSCLHLFLMASQNNLDREDYHDTLMQILDSGVDINLVDDDQKLAIDIKVAKKRKDCIRTVKMEIVIRMAANMKVCPRNTQALVGPEFNKFRATCDQEVAELKTSKDPITGFFYYDILHKCLHTLALRLKNKKFDLEDGLDGDFFEYEDMINYRLKKASQRLELFNKVENVLYEIFYKELPAIFIHELYFYLSNADLWKMS
ncbi:uncharacterized protein LOC123271977 [Cotesia glomerata]|uniref:uncharacterized protein LOC123271977 n=1 Tax=Cotesia glomerata TaxID=32391 RepID=UPI001D009463|nr:uncharacterized protein LOC123271977 [Cotesia glomerata]